MSFYPSFGEDRRKQARAARIAIRNVGLTLPWRVFWHRWQVRGEVRRALVVEITSGARWAAEYRNYTGNVFFGCPGEPDSAALAGQANAAREAWPWADVWIVKPQQRKAATP